MTRHGPDIFPRADPEALEAVMSAPGPFSKDKGRRDRIEVDPGDLETVLSEILVPSGTLEDLTPLLRACARLWEQLDELERPTEAQRREARSLIALVLSYGKDELAEKLAMKYLDDLGLSK